METIWKRKQTNKQTSGGGICRGMDAGGGAELHSMWSPIHNASEYMEELWRCFRDASEKHGVRYAGSYSDIHLKQANTPPAIPGWRRILTKEFCCDDDGDQE